MQSRYTRFYQLIIVLGDILLLNLAFLLAGALRFDEIRIRETQYYDYYVQLGVFLNIMWLLLNFVFKTFQIRQVLEPRKSTSKVLNAYFLHLFFLLLFLVVLKKEEYSRLFLIYFYSVFFLTILPWRFYFIRFLKELRYRGFSHKPVILLGQGSALQSFYQASQAHPEYGLKVMGYFSDDPSDAIPHSGSLAQVKSYLDKNPAEEIYCSFSSDDEYARWFRFADENLLRFRVVPELTINKAVTVDIDFLADVPVLVHRNEPLEYWHNRILKRASDLLISTLVIVLVFPWLLPILAVGVKLSGKGPVFFVQKRSGLRDDTFNIYKFRSMVVNAGADKQQATARDQRLTLFGKFLRRYSLDELPQLFNVWKGDMSVVGPRPHMLAHTRHYRQLVDQFMVRHLAKPGITGLAQVRGLRGHFKTDQDMTDRVRADVYYIENWSLLLDFRIILDTLWQMLLGKNQGV